MGPSDHAGRPALRDRVTGLPTLDLFHDRLQHALARRPLTFAVGAISTGGVPMSRFELASLALGVSKNARTGDTVSTLGDSTVMVILDPIQSEEHAVGTIRRITSTLGSPLVDADDHVRPVRLTGVVTMPGPGDTAETILRRLGGDDTARQAA